jgi:hypothetical protein
LALAKLRKLGGRKHAEKRQAALVAMIVGTFDGSARTHNRKPDHASFSWDELRRRLHAQNSSRCHALLVPFFDYPVDRKRFYKGSTKPYALKPHVIAACETWARESGRAVIPTITHERALDAVEVAQAQGNLKAAAGLKLAADQIEAASGQPNAYAGQQSHGRLQPDTSGTHLVNMPRDQRKLLLQQGEDGEEERWDYDCESCHPRLFVDLCRHYDLPHTPVQHYIDHKAQAAVEWAKMIGHDKPDDIKEIVLSWLNGAALSASPRQTCGRLLGPERARRFIALRAVVAIHGEMQSSMQQIVTRLANKQNAVGLALPENATFKQQCNHILTGYEQFVLRVICSRLPQDSLVTTVYDGWISRVELSDQQLRDLEEQVRLGSRRELSIALNVKIAVKAFRDAAYYGFSKEDA